MACRYYYRGHLFNSEMELDDFLIEQRRFEPILGDLVFKYDRFQAPVVAKIEQVLKQTEELKGKRAEWEREQKMIYGEDGDLSLIKNPPYDGVNSYLSGLRDQFGNLMFPEFRRKTYWAKRKERWLKGDFTNADGTINEAEVDEFGIDINNSTPIPESELNARVEQMERRWKFQGKAGTAIHRILEIMFTKQGDNYIYKLPKDQIIGIVNRRLTQEHKNYIKGNTIEQTIEHGIKLGASLNATYGENAIFYPEFNIAQKTNTTEDVTLFGVVDLLIIDKTGKVHILDYKTSVHSYTKFNSVKKQAYNYQMGVYQRMLQKYGINTYEGELLVSPIQLTNFRGEGDSENRIYNYDGVTALDEYLPVETALSQKMWENIDGFMRAPTTITISGDEINTNTSKWMAASFPSYNSSRQITEKYVIQLLKNSNQLTPDENGIYTFRKYSKEAPIKSSDKVDFIKKVQDYLESLPGSRLKLTGEVKNFIKQAQKEGINSVQFPSPSDAKSNSESDRNYITNTLAKYCNDAWEVVDNPVYESYGIVQLQTKDDIPGVPQQVDFIRISTNDLHLHYRKYLKGDKELKNRTNLVSRYESDVQAYSKSGQLMAQAVWGNVEIMEMLAIISQSTNMQGCVIGNMQVLNPVYATGVQLSNEQALYCFNELNRYNALKGNNLKDLKFAKKYELLLEKLNQIMYAGEQANWEDGYKSFKRFKSSIPNWDQFINSDTEKKIIALKQLQRELESNEQFKIKMSNKYTQQRDLEQNIVAINNLISYSIAQLRGVDFRQQINDHDKWLESIFIHKQGLTGSYLDNPGNLSSDTLNLVTKMVTEAYQNTRDDMQRYKSELDKYLKVVKQEAGFNSVTAVAMNQANIYQDLYKVTSDGNFVFKNPNELPQGPKRALLEYALTEINKRRLAGESKEDIEIMKQTNDPRYYQVPLLDGGKDSRIATQGMMSLLKAKLSKLAPNKVWETAKAKTEGFFEKLEESEEQQDEKIIDLYRMGNKFDLGEKENRIEQIKETGIENLEHNLETLLLNYMFAYSVQENMDAVMPMIRAAMVHITVEGGMKNRPFNNDIQYFEEYLKSKVHNQSIVNSNNKRWVKVAETIKKAASKLTLAFAPVQMFYQPLQGLWQDISLWIRQPDGKNSFTFSHFMQSIKLVFGDFVNYSDKSTLCKLINELYGINDMDMNVYVDRISNAKKGFWNMENFMFKFASRPDFYNRMIIFTSQMIGDGCLEAHSIDSNGKLKYDWRLDKRFSEFAKNPNGNTEIINQQRQLYYAVAKQFINENAKNSDGTPFVLNMSKPNPLPRAYTNREAESMKSLGDDIYGYYSHEKKSLIMSTAIGSLWLQFRTYWSGKKNQYLGKGGVKLKGNWKHYEENGQKYYYQVDEDGTIRYDLPTTTTPTSAPVMQWEGQWQEGILLTLADMVQSMWDHKSILKGFKDKWNNEDDRLQLAYRNNLKQGMYDLIMFSLVGTILGALLGDWLDDLKGKNKKNKDFTTGLGIAAANVAVMSVKNSFLDLNFLESVGAPFTSWTPFAFEFAGRMGKNWWNVAVGDEDFWDGVVKTSGGLKQIKPALDAIKPDMFRTEREGGAFNKKD